MQGSNSDCGVAPWFEVPFSPWRGISRSMCVKKGPSGQLPARSSPPGMAAVGLDEEWRTEARPHLL